MSSQNTEEAWASAMRAALSGDSAAYRTLLAALAGALRPMVRGALARAGRGNAEVEDIVQETLLAIHLKRETWDTGLPFLPWFRAVARYKIIDSLRRSGVRATLPIEDFYEVIPAPENNDADLGDAERLMAQLEERPRAIVRAVSLEGRSAVEVATSLGMSEGAVRVALHRALKTLALLYRREAEDGAVKGIGGQREMS